MTDPPAPIVINSEGGTTVEVDQRVEDPRVIEITIDPAAPAELVMQSAPESVEVTAEAVIQDVVLTAGVGVAGPPGPPGAAGGGHRFFGHGAPGVIVGAAPGDEYVDTDTGDLYVLR